MYSNQYLRFQRRNITIQEYSKLFGGLSDLIVCALVQFWGQSVAVALGGVCIFVGIALTQVGKGWVYIMHALQQVSASALTGCFIITVASCHTCMLCRGVSHVCTAELHYQVHSLCYAYYLWCFVLLYKMFQYYIVWFFDLGNVICKLIKMKYCAHDILHVLYFIVSSY